MIKQSKKLIILLLYICGILLSLISTFYLLNDMETINSGVSTVESNLSTARFAENNFYLYQSSALLSEENAKLLSALGINQSLVPYFYGDTLIFLRSMALYYKVMHEGYYTFSYAKEIEQMNSDQLQNIIGDLSKSNYIETEVNKNIQFREDREDLQLNIAKYQIIGLIITQMAISLHIYWKKN